jgi:hypothetical protein
MATSIKVKVGLNSLPLAATTTEAQIMTAVGAVYPDYAGGTLVKEAPGVYRVDKQAGSKG